MDDDIFISTPNLPASIVKGECIFSTVDWVKIYLQCISWKLMLSRWTRSVCGKIF